jgi:hypothetical protein
MHELVSGWKQQRSTRHVDNSVAQQIRHGDVHIRLRDSDHHHRDANADRNRGGQQDGG